MSLSQVFQLSIPDAGAVDFRVDVVRGREAIHAPFSFEIGCAALESGANHLAAGADPSDWIGCEAALSWAVADGAERRIEAVIEAVTSRAPSCSIILVPPIAVAMDAADHRVFVDRDAIAVARVILDEHGIELQSRVIAAPPARAQLIQAFEADLAFVARILADEGIAYYLSEDGKQAVCSDDPSGYDDLGLLLSFRESGGLEAGEAVYSARLARRAVVEEVVLRDYDFERPMLDLTARTGDGSRGLTHFEHLAGHRDAAAGKALAAVRLGELGARRLILTGETGARALRPGGIVELTGGARDEMNGRWLVVEIEHDGKEREGDASTYRARFTAVPLAAGFRPRRVRAPRFGGVQTAIVTGASGAEIHTEQHGRARVSHRWDRRSSGDDRSSAWARTAQPATSGSIFLPRVGWEVLVGFAGKGGDEPIVLGRLDNGQAPPPEGLPAGKIKSALGTRTTPGGGSVNRIATNDTAGAEGMSFGASKDFNERSDNDKVTVIKASDSWNIGATSSLRVGTVFEQAVTGSQTFVVGAFRSENIGSNLSYSAATEVVIVGGMRLITAGGDHSTSCAVFLRVVAGAEVQSPIEHQTRFVEGASLVVNGSAWSTKTGLSAGVAVGGGAGLTVSGPMSITAPKYALNVKGFLWEKYATRTVSAGGGVADIFRASGTYRISGGATLTGSEVVVEATTSLTIKAGRVVVELTPGKITVNGRFSGTCDSVQSKSSKFG